MPSRARGLVALLAEGVDRNKALRKHTAVVRVALLAEGVDRNLFNDDQRVPECWSPSSRRAWIEITSLMIATPLACSRPPRGGRG